MDRNLSIDIFKMCLAVFVVFLHTGFFYDISQEISFLLVQGFFRIAVPAFLVITGYYFFFITDRKKFLTWLSRVVILFLIWNIFYLPLWFTSNLKMVLFTLFNGYFVLWYLSGTALAGCLLFLLRDLKSQYLLILSLLLYAIGWAIQEVGNLHVFPGIIDKLLNFTPLYRNFLFLCFPFLALGFLIHKHRSYVDRYKINIGLVLGLLGLVIIESYLNYNFISKAEGLDQLFVLFLAVPILFIYVLRLEIKGRTKSLASLSAAIFLIHPLFLFFFRQIIPTHQYTLISLFVLLSSILAGLILVRLNQRLKYIL